MCIRDSIIGVVARAADHGIRPRPAVEHIVALEALDEVAPCLLYTSDAADERSSVDLGGRRIIKKKTSEGHSETTLHTEQLSSDDDRCQSTT